MLVLAPLLMFVGTLMQVEINIKHSLDWCVTVMYKRDRVSICAGRFHATSRQEATKSAILSFRDRSVTQQALELMQRCDINQLTYNT